MTDPGNTEPAEPFVFRLTEDKLRECRHMTAEEKLRWLEEANAFVRKFVPSERLERWARFRERGQVRPDERGGEVSA